MVDGKSDCKKKDLFAGYILFLYKVRKLQKTIKQNENSSILYIKTQKNKLAKNNKKKKNLLINYAYVDLIKQKYFLIGNYFLV